MADDALFDNVTTETGALAAFADDPIIVMPTIVMAVRTAFFFAVFTAPFSIKGIRFSWSRGPRRAHSLNARIRARRQCKPGQFHARYLVEMRQEQGNCDDTAAMNHRMRTNKAETWRTRFASFHWNDPLRHEFTFAEFFAGGGMARLGLSDSWQCLLANDIDPQKCATYRENFGGDDLIEGDIAQIGPSQLPSRALDLMWGSFPCQDLSLAGARGGLGATRSGTFFSFWSIAQSLIKANKRPKVICVENVSGLLSSNAGNDIDAVLSVFTSAGYQVNVSTIDAKAFVPQSRPRLFIIAVARELLPCPQQWPAIDGTQAPAIDRLRSKFRDDWFDIGEVPMRQRKTRLSDIIDWNAPNWNDDATTKMLLAMMAPTQRDRVRALVDNGARRCGTAFRRTRTENGNKIQRVEARFDGLAGCLRTPAGGSSRQIVITVASGKVRTRLMSPREAAALMGLPKNYRLPDSDTAALRLCGDGVCVPVVRWLADTVFEPILSIGEKRQVA